MLQKNAISLNMFDMLKELQGNILFQEHILAGGTALSLQLGHRTSTDIDLFTQKPQNAVIITDYFKDKYSDVDIDYANNDFIRLYVNNIKIEMAQYDEKIVEPPKDEEGIRLFTLNEIAAMKLNAIMRRTEPRDFIDIAYLLKEMSLKTMFEVYKNKYDSISPLYMKRLLLTKSESIKNNEWLVGGIKMLRDDIDLNKIPDIIKQAIEQYNISINIGSGIIDS